MTAPDHHPLDGNMIAADAHYESEEPPQDGDPCPGCEEGTLFAGIGRGLICDDCGKVFA